MIRRFVIGASALVSCAFLLFSTLSGFRGDATAGDPAGKEAPGKDVFGPTKVWSIHLEIAAHEYEALQPRQGGFGFPGGPPKQPAPKDAKDKRDGERNLFGTEFPWAQAKLAADGKAWDKIGVRYAGDITYFASAQRLKRPMKIAFDKFGGQAFHGLATLDLHAMPLDPAKGREVLAYSVFRAAGVPAPRTAFAEVTLTVPGKYDKEILGLYVLVESVDRPFLADRFGTDKGALLKPFQVRSVDAFGDDWDKWKGAYRPQSEPTRDEIGRLMAFAKLVNQAKDDEFQKEIAGYLDVDAFLRFLAANTLTSNLESALALGHNYYLYLNPRSNKFVFIPGDLEFALANFLLMGNANELMDLSLTHPYPGANKLVDRLLAIKDVNEKYRSLLKDLSVKEFTRERLLKEIDAIDQATKEPLAQGEEGGRCARKGRPASDRRVARHRNHPT